MRIPYFLYIPLPPSERFTKTYATFAQLLRKSCASIYHVSCCVQYITSILRKYDKWGSYFVTHARLGKFYESHIADIIFGVVLSRETSLMMLHVWEEDIGSEGGIYQ